MTEKLNTQDCIARVYQFLSDYNKSGNWQEDADTNGDETIIQTEFRGFMLKNISGWNGERKYDSEDIINKFWKSINTQTTGFANTKGTSNKIALDEKELKDMAKNLAISDAIRAYADSITDFPNFIKNNQDLKNEYLDFIKSSLFAKVQTEQDIKSFEYSEDKRTEFISKITDKLSGLYPECAKTATANLCKQQVVDKVKALGIQGYDADKDKSLEKIINGYLNEIKNKANMTPDQIYNELMTLINEYLQTADKSLPSGSYTPQTGMKASDGTTDLNIKYILGSNTGLNDIQKAVLNTGLTGKIVSKLTAHKDYGPIYADATKKAMIDTKISSFVSKTIQDNASKSFEEIKKLYDSAADTFINTEMKTIKEEIDNLQTQLDTARKELKDACKYGKKYEEALKAVFDGKSDKTSIEAYINGETDITVLQAKKTDITSRISSIDSTPTKVEDKSQAVYDKLSTVVNKSAKMTYRILNDGTIEFVEYQTTGGIFAAAKSTTVQYYFNKVKDELEGDSGYKEELNEIFGDDAVAKKNLFNIALLTTLSDVSVVEEPYQEMVLQQVVVNLIQNYRKLLQNAANKDNVANYIKNYQDASMIAGRTLAVERDGRNQYIDNVGGTMTKNLNNYYKDNSTEGSDDWVDCSNQRTATYSTIGGSGEILYLNSGSDLDNKKTNDALVKILGDYIAKNKAYLDVNKIIKLFKEAEEIAFDKLSKTKHCWDPGKSQIYGYSESGSLKNARGENKDYADYDTWSGHHHSVQAILLEVMYEMDSLIAKELLK